MASIQQLPTEFSLDPEDWEGFELQCEAVLSDMLENQRTVSSRPVWEKLPDEARDHIRAMPDRRGSDFAEIYEEFRRSILPYPLGNGHPRHWGWVNGTGTPVGAMADLMAATMNPNCWGAKHAPNAVETAVVDWMKSYMDFPADAAGLLVSGASAATLNGLGAARNAKVRQDVREYGLDFSNAPRPLVYMTEEVHYSAPKAVEFLGLGRKSIRWVPTRDFAMDAEALAETIAQDRRRGAYPAIVVATIGTVKTGAIDPLHAIADICSENDLWLHVDGAFGAMTKLAARYRHLSDGIERADSLAFDFHKWGYQPYDVAVSLVRNGSLLRSAFQTAPTYLSHLSGGIAQPETQFSDLGIELSRGFRGLKLWFALKTHGPDGIGVIIDQNIDQAKYLAGLVQEKEVLELFTGAPMNIVTFRYRHSDMEPDTLNRLNEWILVTLQERGIAAPSSVVINDRFLLRVAITNHRSKNADFVALVEAVESLGREGFETLDSENG